jgi:hypothetical protein
MSMSNQFETDFLNLVFKNQAATGIGDASGLLASATSGSLYVSLHTSDPGEAGDQSTNEATFGGYARVAVPRGAGWTVSSPSATNSADINFPACTSGNNTITHFGIGTSSSGAGKLLFSGAFGASISVSSGITLSILAGNLSTTVN